MKKKRGGNGEVEFSEGIATKKLHFNALKSKEKRERFKKEIEVLIQIKKENIENIVEIIDFDINETEPFFTMPQYDGNLNGLLDITRENVKSTVSLLLPLVKSLFELSKLEEPIYHRDIKPDNILYKRKDKELDLFLADFGCAYLKTGEDDRITQEFRAIGAMAFRAPEYQYGKVNDVTEKGDIFSIGKLFWFLINGNGKEIFPYTLWFPPEYDLSLRFKNIEYIEHINLIIASCVNHNPVDRIGYPELIKQLDNLLGMKQDDNKDSELRLKLLRKDETSKLEITQKYTETKTLLKIFVNDMRSTLNLLHKQYGDITIINQILTSFKVLYGESTTIDTVVNKESDCPIWNANFPSLTIGSRIHPAKGFRETKVGTLIPFIEFGCNVTDTNRKNYRSAISLVKTADQGLVCIYEGEVSQYSKEILYKMWIKILNDMTR
jgi:serine/threonine protein kinase